MLRVVRGMRGLQRRFATIVLASILIFLVYLLLSHSGHLQSARSVQERDHPVILPDRDQSLSHDGVVHMRRESDAPPAGGQKPIMVNGQPMVKITTTTTTRKPEPPPPVQEIKQEEVKIEPVEFEHVEDNKKLPPLATDLSDPYSGPRNREQQEIVSAFMHAWRHYKKYAWGHDELKPVSKGWQEWMGIGLTIVDSLDTIYIMGLKDEFKEGRDWVANSLSFDRDNDVQLFEITIRALGGLLSAYHLSGDKVFLDKALDLGNRLYPCFSGETKVPCNRISLRRSRAHFIDISTAESGTIQLEFRDLARSSGIKKFEVLLGNTLDPCFRGLTPIPCNRINLRFRLAQFGHISVAESASIQLEFRALARASGNKTYETAVEGVSNHLHKLPKLDGLVPCFLNAHTGEFRASSTVSVGASADSYYEYLVKQWIQTGKTRDWMKTDYVEAVQGMQTHLYRHTFREHLGFVGSYVNMNSRSFRADMEHLACFLPGTLALGYMAGLQLEDHLKMAENLTRTCYEMYHRTATGLSPEVAAMSMNHNMKSDIYFSSAYSYNLQRPETVESIFYMYRLTKDPKYRRWGWEIFQAFEKYTRLEDGGYASISNVKNAQAPGYKDKMETFYLAETLKYLYLLFSDDPDLIPLDKFVINTEAHPLPVYTS